MRAPMSIASWVMDGTIEAVARALRLDPIERAPPQHADAAELPWTMPAGPVLEDVTPRETLDAALAAFDVPGFRARQAADRARGVYRGMGLCCVVEANTYGSAFYRAAGIPGSGHEAGWVKVAPSGAVDVSVGLMASGQGYETALAQAAAEGLGVPIDTRAAASRQYRHRALRHGQPRRARRHRRQLGAAAGRPDAAAQDVRDRRRIARVELGRRSAAMGRPRAARDRGRLAGCWARLARHRPRRLHGSAAPARRRWSRGWKRTAPTIRRR